MIRILQIILFLTPLCDSWGADSKLNEIITKNGMILKDSVFIDPHNHVPYEEYTRRYRDFYEKDSYCQVTKVITKYRPPVLASPDVQYRRPWEVTHFIEVFSQDNSLWWRKEFKDPFRNGSPSEGGIQVIPPGSSNLIVFSQRFTSDVDPEPENSIYVYDSTGVELFRIFHSEFNIAYAVQGRISPSGIYVAVRVRIPSGYGILFIDIIQKRYVMYPARNLSPGGINDNGTIRLYNRKDNSDSILDVNNLF